MSELGPLGTSIVVSCGCIGGLAIAASLATDALLAAIGLPIGCGIGAGGAGVLATYRRTRAIGRSMLLCYAPPLAAALIVRNWFPDQVAFAVAGILWLFFVLVTIDYGRYLRRRRIRSGDRYRPPGT